MRLAIELISVNTVRATLFVQKGESYQAIGVDDNSLEQAQKNAVVSVYKIAGITNSGVKKL